MCQCVGTSLAVAPRGVTADSTDEESIVDTISIAWLLVISLAIGMLIGAVGIGGVLIIPLLSMLAGLGIHEAMATALATFVATGLVGTYLFHRKGSIDWRLTIPVCSGAPIFGFAGAYVNSVTNAELLTVLVAGVVLFAGLYTIVRWQSVPRPAFHGLPRAQWTLLFGVGAFAGFAAGLTGVGGSVLSVPVMVLFGFPMLPTIGVGQVIQLIAAGSGTLGNIAYGTIHMGLIIPVAACQMVGVVGGVYLVHMVDVDLVRRLVALLCVAIGIAMMGRALRIF